MEVNPEPKPISEAGAAQLYNRIIRSNAILFIIERTSINAIYPSSVVSPRVLLHCLWFQFGHW